jgi:hypothetical protein
VLDRLDIFGEDNRKTTAKKPISQRTDLSKFGTSSHIKMVVDMAVNEVRRNIL